jgi:hypothetical protein
MRKLVVATITLLSLCIAASAQNAGSLVKLLQKIKPLESTRIDAGQVLYLYERETRDEHEEIFSGDGFNVRVVYSSGQCSEESDEEELSDVWRVTEWTVVAIAVEFEQPMSLENLGFATSKFMKEQRFVDSKSAFVYHNKETGINFYADRDGVDRVEFFPSSAKSRTLCEDNEYFKEFYSRKSWYATKLEKRTGIISCPFANVESVELSRKEILGATADKNISVTTSASDPENDVLKYVYLVSAGQIRGQGPKVIWDLTGVPAGTYTITAGVDDGCGLCGKTFTTTVVIK